MAQRVLPRWRILGTRQTGKGERAMTGLLCVGAGGALGAMGRYSLGLIPLGGELPLMTLLINFLGSVAIGAIVETSELAAGAFPARRCCFEGGPMRRIHDVLHLLAGDPRAHRGRPIRHRRRLRPGQRRFVRRRRAGRKGARSRAHADRLDARRAASGALAKTAKNSKGSKTGKGAFASYYPRLQIV